MSCCGGGAAKKPAAMADDGGIKEDVPMKDGVKEEVKEMPVAQADKKMEAVDLKETHSVPLAVSSMAHCMCLPPDLESEGVMEALCQVVHHTLQEIQIHAPPPIQATEWTVHKTPTTISRHSFLYSGDEEPMIPDELDEEKWASIFSKNVLGRISLYHALKEQEESSGEEALFTQAVVEYRSMPSKLTAEARNKEESSLTSFGGSVDDDVKLGALCALNDEVGKYVLTITSVRGKMYRYGEHEKMAQVTVSEHMPTSPSLTRLELTLDGEPSNKVTGKPSSFPSKQLEEQFLVWDSPASTTVLPSRQTLLLDPGQKTYINGRLLHSGESLPPSLFGWNLERMPAWHDRIQNLEVVKQAYATLWQEALIDARLEEMDLASFLLNRLIYGVDEDNEDENVNEDCLESVVMASAKYDPVGICAKALATRFAVEFGKFAVPCLAHEVEWYKARLGHRPQVVVPRRVIDVLRRGGYFDLARETNEVWFTENIRPATEENEKEAVKQALSLIKEAGWEEAVHVMFVKLDAPDPVKNKFMCRYNDVLMQYHVNEAVWKLDEPAKAIAMYVAQELPDGLVLLNLLCKQPAK